MMLPLPDSDVIDLIHAQHGISREVILASWNAAWRWVGNQVPWAFAPKPIRVPPREGLTIAALFRLRAMHEPNPRTKAALNYCAYETLAPYQ